MPINVAIGVIIEIDSAGFALPDTGDVLTTKPAFEIGSAGTVQIDHGSEVGQAIEFDRGGRLVLGGDTPLYSSKKVIDLSL